MRDRRGRAPAPARGPRRRPRPGGGGKTGLIERASAVGAALGLAVWCEDEAGPFQAVPHPGRRWRPQGRPATQPHQYVRGGTCKLLTLFHPATGRLHPRPVASGTNPVRQGWLKETLTAIVAASPVRAEPIDAAVTRAAWEVWQAGLAERSTLPEHPPPLRVLLVWDTLAGHKSAEMVVWLCRHGIMPLHTPLGGSWLTMAESIRRILKRRALGGQHPRNPAEIGSWFEQTAHAWNRQPTPFLWNGERRRRRRQRPGDGHPVGGSRAHTQHPGSATGAAARNGASRGN